MTFIEGHGFANQAASLIGRFLIIVNPLQTDVKRSYNDSMRTPIRLLNLTFRTFHGSIGLVSSDLLIPSTGHWTVLAPGIIYFVFKSCCDAFWREHGAVNQSEPDRGDSSFLV